MAVAVFALMVGVVVAVLVVAARRSDPERVVVGEVCDAGLVALDGGADAGGRALIPWADVDAVELVVGGGRPWRRVRYGFVVRAGDDVLTVPGRGGAAFQFLAEAYHLPGFDHRRVRSTLERGASATVGCFRRWPG